jgi:hypothetical protein
MSATQVHRRSVLRLALAIGALGMIACAAQAAPPPAPTLVPAAKTPAVTSSSSPDARGRAVLQAQLAALGDNEAFAATFAAQATVLTSSGANEVHAFDSHAASAIGSLNPHAEVQSATFDHFVSGSAGQIAWFAADLHITVVSREPESQPSTESATVRAIELLDATAGWKVTVAAFTSVASLNKSGACNIRDVTDAGPLTSLLTSPPAIAAALGDGAVVYGTDPSERGLGTKDARALLARWKNLTISLDEPPKIREVRGAMYGYAMGKVHITTKPGGPSYSLNAFLLALPIAGGKWSVIGASYGAL